MQVRGPAFSQNTLQGAPKKEMINRENNFAQVSTNDVQTASG